MQGRAAAIYGVVFLLVAAGAVGYVTAVDAPEPTMENPDDGLDGLAEGDEFPITNDAGEERVYTVGELGEQRGQPTITLLWTDDDAQATEDWEYDEEPGSPSVVFEGSEFYVRPIDADEEDPDSFLLQEHPPEDANVSLFVDADGNWVVNEDGNYTAVEEYEGLERLEVSEGESFDEGDEDDVRTVTVEEVTTDVVTVTWTEPVENEILLRQTAREELNDVDVTIHVDENGLLYITSDEEEIDRYIEAHEDRDHFEQRSDGLIGIAVLALVTMILLAPLSQLPRKE